MPCLDGRKVLRVLREAGLRNHEIQVVRWAENELGERKSYGFSLLAVALMNSRKVETACAALRAQGYVLFAREPYNGKYPTFALLQE